MTALPLGSLTFPKQCYQLGLSVDTHEPMGDTSHSNHPLQQVDGNGENPPEVGTSFSFDAFS